MSNSINSLIGETRYADIKLNDSVNGEGICVSFWTQGCKHRCKNCHNPETWSKDGGKILTEEIVANMIEKINANNVQRNFSILGGEPLMAHNLPLVNLLLKRVKKAYPNIKTYVWTGYKFEDFYNIGDTFEYIDVLIDGLFIEEKKDLNLKLRGSSNQRIIDVQKSIEEERVVLYDILGV